MPKGDSHTAILKKSRGFTDLMVQKSREGNKGCFLISWAFLPALVALVVFGLKAAGCLDAPSLNFVGEWLS